MKQEQIIVSLKEGLDSRKAAVFVQEAIRFESRIYILMENQMVNAKSIMGVVSLGMLDHDKITIRADGPDEEEAVVELVHLLKENLL